MKKSELIRKLATEIAEDGDAYLLKYSITEAEMTSSWHRHSLKRKDEHGRPKPMTASEFIEALERKKIGSTI